MLKEDKAEVMRLLLEQLETERRLVEMYKETSPLISSKSAEWLLFMLQMDSRKHIAVFSLAIDILEGLSIESTDRQEITVGLEKHLDLEKDSIERAKKLKANRLVKENSGLSRLLETWADEERHHHAILQRLKDEKYVRVDAFEAYIQFRRTAFEQLNNEIKKLLRKL
jgi:hypothetical protein